MDKWEEIAERPRVKGLLEKLAERGLLTQEVFWNILKGVDRADRVPRSGWRSIGEVMEEIGVTE